MIKQLRKIEPDDLQGKLTDRADSMVEEIRDIPWAILHEGYYRKASEGYTPFLDELRVEIDKLDPVTAA